MWNTGNMNAVKILKNGSMILELKKVGIKIHSLCTDISEQVYPEWINRTKNTIADKICKILDDSNLLQGDH